ncbi:MAG: hypothetical protein WCJ56_11655 [bacterium]
MRYVRSKILRVYVDTSVFGGVFDAEFSIASSKLFHRIRQGRFQLIVSGLVQKEIANAPQQVQDLFYDIIQLAEIVDVDENMLRLMHGYIDAKIVTDKWRDDALHVAQATVAGCNLIVSWNFKHIVHYEKIPLYNAVNVLHGYNNIAIHSPLEVISDEK